MPLPAFLWPEAPDVLFSVSGFCRGMGAAFFKQNEPIILCGKLFDRKFKERVEISDRAYQQA